MQWTVEVLDVGTDGPVLSVTGKLPGTIIGSSVASVQSTALERSTGFRVDPGVGGVVRRSKILSGDEVCRSSRNSSVVEPADGEEL